MAIEKLPCQLTTESVYTSRWKVSGVAAVAKWDKEKREWAKEGADSMAVTCKGTGFKSELKAVFFVRRIPWTIVLEVHLVTTLLSYGTLFAFSIPPADVADRLTFILTTILTFVALRFSITEKLPELGYVTVMDMKIVFELIVMFILSLYFHLSTLPTWDITADLDSLDVREDIMKTDRSAYRIFLATITVAQLAFWCHAWRLHRAAGKYC